MEAAALATLEQRSDPWNSREPWLQLFQELAVGRIGALAHLYDLASTRLYGLALWRTGSRDDAADVVQEVFVHVAVEERERLARIRDPRGWLLAVAHRLAVDVTRLRARRPTEPLEEHPFLEAPTDQPERALDARRASLLLARLSPNQREVIFLRDFAGMSFADIGRAIGVPTFTAASRYRLGLARLRRLCRSRP